MAFEQDYFVQQNTRDQDQFTKWCLGSYACAVFTDFYQDDIKQCKNPIQYQENPEPNSLFKENRPFLGTWQYKTETNDEPEWDVLFQSGFFGSFKPNKETYNQIYKNAGTGIIRRVCYNCNRNEIYYVRKTKIDTFDAYHFMMETWASKPENLMHKDFDIYSTFEDAMQQRNPWNWCNYDALNVGFPRNCGAIKFIGGDWNSFLPNKGIQDYEYSVLKATAPTKTYTYHISPNGDQLTWYDEQLHKSFYLTDQVKYRFDLVDYPNCEKCSVNLAEDDRLMLFNHKNGESKMMTKL